MARSLDRRRERARVTTAVPHLNRSILKLAIPALGALAIDPLLTLADTAFVARLGVVPLAALGVDTAILGFAFFGFNFLAYATTPLVAQAIGRGDQQRARRWVGDAIVLAVGLGVLAAIVLIVAAPGLVGLMGAQSEIADPAIAYLRIRAFATPAVLVVTAGHGAFRGHQDTKTPLVVAAAVNGLNLVLDPILIFTLDLGLEGAAIATVVAQFLGAIWFIRLLSKRHMIDRPSDVRTAIPTILALGRSGALIATRTAMILIAFTFAAATATRLGAAEIAAHQVISQVWLIAVMIADAFAIAGQAMVGDAVGDGDVDRINRLALRLSWWGLGVGIALAIGFFLVRPVLGVLVGEAEVVALAGSVALVAAAMMPYASPLFVADGIFLGLFTLGTIILSTASGAVVAVALMWLTPLGESLPGIWWALAAMMVVRGLVFVFGYRRAVSVAVRS
jgi:MATE family multidrug resistance protein